MAAAVESLTPKKFQAMITGLLRRMFFGEGDTLTDTYLASQLFLSSRDSSGGDAWTAEEEKAAIASASSMFSSYECLLRRAAFHRWSPSELSSHLEESQEGLGVVDPKQRELLQDVWSREHTKVWRVIVERSLFGSALKKVSWRVDVQTDTKEQSDVNAATAIMRLFFEGRGCEEAENEIQFEVGPDDIEKLVGTIEEVEAAITKIAR